MQYIEIELQARWTSQKMFLIIGVLLVLSMSQAKFVWAYELIDHCNAGAFVPQLPTSCSTCENRCGNLTNISDIHSHKQSPAYCSCDTACFIYGDCCPDFNMFCPDIYYQAELLADNNPNVNTGCLPLYVWETNSHDLDVDGLTLSVSNLLMVHTCNTTDTPCYSANNIDQVALNTFIPVTDRITGIHYRNVVCAHCNGITDLIPWEINIQCSPKSSYLNTTIGNPPLNDWLASYLVSNAINGTILSGDMLSKVTESLSCNFKFKHPIMHPFRYCWPYYLMVSTCSYSCKNIELVHKCKEPTQSYSTDKNIRQTTYKNFYCAMCNHMDPDDIKCGQFGRVYIHDKKIFRGFSLTLLMDYSSNVGLKVAPPSCEAGHAWFEDELQCKLVECSSGYSLINNSCVSVVSVELINTTIYAHVESREYFLFENSQYMCNVIENKLGRDLQSIDNLQNVHIRISEDGEEHTESNVWNSTLYVFIEYKENMTHITQYRRVMKVVINVFQSAVIEFFESRNITLSVFKLSVGQVENKWFNSEVCAGYTYTPHQYNIVSAYEVQVIASDRHYTGDEFYISDGMLHVCVSHDDRQIKNVSTTFGIITITCSILSIICLANRLVLQFIISSYNTFPGRLQFNLVLALFLAFLLLLVTPTLISHQVACSIGGAFKHWAFMAAFCWMNNIAFHTWSVFRSTGNLINQGEGNKSLTGFMLYGWFLPFIIAAVAYGIDYVHIDSTFQPRYDEGFCWISQTNALIVFFIAPIAVCLIANVGFYIHTSLSLSKSFKISRVLLSTNERNKENGVYMRLFVLMGITWILGFIGSAIDKDFLWYIYIILNASQGIFIFIAFVVNKHNIGLIRERYIDWQRGRM